jgi:hypothetical protein
MGLREGIQVGWVNKQQSRSCCDWGCVVFFVAMSCVPAAAAQGLPGLLTGQKATSAPPATDPLKRTTPRSAIYGLLESCHEGNLALASQYLDLRGLAASERAEQGPSRAKDLCSLLDRDPQFEVDQLSNSVQGNLQEAPAPGREKLATFEPRNGQTITLEMQRLAVQGVNVWLVSADSVERVSQLNALLGESPFEKRLPETPQRRATAEAVR